MRSRQCLSRTDSHFLVITFAPPTHVLQIYPRTKANRNRVHSIPMVLVFSAWRTTTLLLLNLLRPSCFHNSVSAISCALIFFFLHDERIFFFEVPKWQSIRREFFLLPIGGSKRQNFAFYKQPWCKGATRRGKKVYFFASGSKSLGGCYVVVCTILLYSIVL